LIGYDTPQSFERWARSEDFGSPVRWGTVKRKVLRRRVPVLDDDSRAFDLVIGAVTAAMVVFVVVPFFGAPVVSLVATLLARATEGGSADTWVFLAQLFAILSAALGLAIIVSWWVDGREGSVMGLAACVLVVAAMVPTYLLLGDLGRPDADSAQVYALVAAVVGAAGVVLSALGKPSGALPFGRGRVGRMPAIKQNRYRHARAHTLDVLQQRGLIHLEPAQKEKMTQMRLGTWHTLDDIPSA